MLTLTQKEIKALSTEEKIEIYELIKNQFPSSSKGYIDSKISKIPEFDVVFLRNKNTLLGISYYKNFKLITPFSKRKLRVVHFGLALKSNDYSGNIIWRMGQWYARKNIGYLFAFKKVVGVSVIGSPKVFENFIKLFPNNLFNFSGEEDKEVMQFLSKFFKNHRNTEIEIDNSYRCIINDFEEEDITDVWGKKYKAKSDVLNEFFIEMGMVSFRDNKIYKTNKMLIGCGFKEGMNTLFE